MRFRLLANEKTPISQVLAKFKHFIRIARNGNIDNESNLYFLKDVLR